MHFTAKALGYLFKKRVVGEPSAEDFEVAMNSPQVVFHKVYEKYIINEKLSIDENARLFHDQYQGNSSFTQEKFMSNFLITKLKILRLPSLKKI